MPARNVADVERDAREGHSGVRRPLRDEPIGDSTLIEDLDGARVQTAGARAVEGLALPQLDDGDVDPRQGQLARQHQPGRARVIVTGSPSTETTNGARETTTPSMRPTA